jgi:hypothetical protein
MLFAQLDAQIQPCHCILWAVSSKINRSVCVLSLRDDETKLLFLSRQQFRSFAHMKNCRAENKSRPGVGKNLRECDVFCVCIWGAECRRERALGALAFSYSLSQRLEETHKKRAERDSSPRGSLCVCIYMRARGSFLFVKGLDAVTGIVSFYRICMKSGNACRRCMRENSSPSSVSQLGVYSYIYSQMGLTAFWN